MTLSRHFNINIQAINFSSTQIVAASVCRNILFIFNILDDIFNILDDDTNNSVFVIFRKYIILGYFNAKNIQVRILS